jgi:hypothetical protein
MASHEKVQMVLDVLWNHKLIRAWYVTTAYERARKFPSLPILKDVLWVLGWGPKRPAMGLERSEFREDFYATVYEALDRLEEMKAHQTAVDMFRPTMEPVCVGYNKYQIEVCLRRFGEPELVGDFPDYHEAQDWMRNGSGEFLRSHNLTLKNVICLP